MNNETLKGRKSETINPKIEDSDSVQIDTFNYNASIDKDSEFRSFIGKFCGKIYVKWVQGLILFLIILNSLVLGLETSQTVMEKAGGLLKILDTLCVVIFCIEILMKVIYNRLKFFKSGWNVFDFVIVMVSIFPISREISIFRAFRVLRTFRVITRFDKLKLLVDAIIRTIPNVGWLIFLLLILMYIFSVITTGFYGKEYPLMFGSIGYSMYTLFQILTLESWSSGVIRPMFEKFPNAYLVFIPYIILSSVIILNVFVGIVVNVVNDVSTKDKLIQEQKSQRGDGTIIDKIDKFSIPSHLVSLEQKFEQLEDKIDLIQEMLKADKK
jgi:voltage-gated sodium channel